MLTRTHALTTRNALKARNALMSRIALKRNNALKEKTDIRGGGTEMYVPLTHVCTNRTGSRSLTSKETC